MPLPSTGYATAAATNPASALTDFTLVVDLADMPAEWWAAVDTSDGTKGRAAKDDGTELPADWIDFDDVNETGWLRVKWSGTLASSGTQTVRIYPPVAANSSYAAGDTYGQDNAYDASWEGYWPLHDGNDRTANGNDLTAGGGVTFGNAAGKVGDATDFELGSSQYATAGTTGLSASAGTVLGWHRPETVAPDSYFIFGHFNSGNRIYVHVTNLQTYVGVGDDFIVGGAGSVVSAGNWYHSGLTWNGGTWARFFGGAQAETGSYTNLSSIGATLAVGALWNGSASNHYDGVLDDVQMHSVARATAWIDAEHDQTNDNAGFWGAWAWNAAAAGATSRPPFRQPRRFSRGAA